LIGVAYVNNPEFDGRTTSLLPDSDDEEEDEPNSTTADKSRYSIVTKHISVMEFGTNFVRLGGKLRISSSVVRPYSFVIAEISGINTMLNLRKRRSLELATNDEKKSLSLSRESLATTALGKDSIMRSFVITKDDLIQQRNKLKSQEIHVGEELIESPYSFLVPIAFLKFLHADRLSEYEVRLFLFLLVFSYLLFSPSRRYCVVGSIFRMWRRTILAIIGDMASRQSSNVILRPCSSPSLTTKPPN
jgi:hypothetical protein